MHGHKGKILAGFLGQDPHIISEKKMREYQASENPSGAVRSGQGGQARRDAGALWVAACKGGRATYGDFLLAGPISDAFNLGAVSLRLGGKRLLFDAASGKITNVAESNKCLGREYRPGWELAGLG